MTLLTTLLTTMLAQAAAAPDQTTNRGFQLSMYTGLKGFILRSAEKMPEEHFTFRPTPEVRSFAALIAHITDANYLLCSPGVGEPNPNGDVVDNTEKKNLARPALLAELNKSFELCDRAYAKLTDRNFDEPLPFFNSTRPRLGMLWFHISHAYEHYGNVVTYLRLKGIVPPSSEPR